MVSPGDPITFYIKSKLRILLFNKLKDTVICIFIHCHIYKYIYVSSTPGKGWKWVSK